MIAVSGRSLRNETPASAVAADMRNLGDDLEVLVIASLHGSVRWLLILVVPRCGILMVLIEKQAFLDLPGSNFRYRKPAISVHNRCSG